METLSKNNVERIGVRYGVLMAFALAGYFLLMKAINLEQNLELRVFNLVILSSFILMAIDRYKKLKGIHLTYLKGVGLGLLTSVVGVFTFATLFLLYITVVDPAFMTVIRENEPFGVHLTPLLVTIAIMIEGVASGFIASFAIMQYYKVSHFVSPHGD
ncbi:DUF4199 family protein [Porifericola rhodea]|uniref:DUF4199 family protein n=1 Tax=Porifericola rhodea TaxID=930972 RepID=UPI0026659039|nr:DUF4199 family protein [Porifericola rhodea]WKN32212.1 DUF4199 family protein [Porifericola rhodea]